MPESERNRIHAIVLTRDRPDTLRRCVSGVLPALGRNDALTVLDDSAQDARSANGSVLRAASAHGRCPRHHLEWGSTCAALQRFLGVQHSAWLVRTHDRDIAPLRNFSLLLAAATPFETVLLVDDDIVDAAPLVMHEEINRLRRPGIGAVLGAELHGVSELDIITRLWQGIDVLTQSHIHTCRNDPKSVFRADSKNAPDSQTSRRYPSGGYLGFSLSPDQMSAFPPGYNEDWLWCLLWRGRQDVEVAWSRHTAIHDPPSVRRPTEEDCIFELTGDLVLDCLELLDWQSDTSPTERLALLGQMEPGADLLPEARLQELRDRLGQANLDEGARSMLLEHGLASLERLSQAGALHGDWRTIVAAWCRSATMVLQSFDAALAEVGILKYVRSAWTEGQVK